MPKVDANAVYKDIKQNRDRFVEEEYCPLLIEIMSDPDKGTAGHFCIETSMGLSKFYRWLNQYSIFKECYDFGQVVAKENYEEEGKRISEEFVVPGAPNTKFEYWKTIGHTRFSVGKASKVRLGLDPNATPNEHYAQLMKQAANGEFTAAEIKQLMEAINVGLNTHQVFELQKEIDKLRADLAVMSENSNGNNTFSDKRTSKED